MKHSIETIAEKHGVILRKFSLDIKLSNSFIGEKKINLGSDPIEEVRNVCFFHELGHIEDDLSKCENRFDQEVRAWVLGFRIANNYGYTFSNATKSVCASWLKTYIDTSAWHRSVCHS